jgi:hypothetical protein
MGVVLKQTARGLVAGQKTSVMAADHLNDCVLNHGIEGLKDSPESGPLFDYRQFSRICKIEGSATVKNSGRRVGACLC